MQNERRKFTRIKLKFKIIIACDGRVLFGTPDNYGFHTFTENLSEDGVMVKLEQQLSDAAIVKLDLFITEKIPFKCKGSVIWTKKVNPENTKPDTFETGIKFVELDLLEKKLIANLVKSFTKKQ